MGLVFAACAAVTPGTADAAFTLTILAAPGGFNGPGGAGPAPGSPDSISYSFGDLSVDRGRLTVSSSREQFPASASIGTTFQLKANSAAAGGGAFVPAGTYTIRLRNDEFTLPPGASGFVGVIHTSIVPFANPPGAPLASTTATSALLGGNSVTVNGSPDVTIREEKFTSKPNGTYTLDQIVTITLPEGGSGQFSVASYVMAAPAPPAVLLGLLGLPLFGVAVRAWRRKGAPTADVTVAT